MWEMGYTDYFAEDWPLEVPLGECSTFVQAIAELYDNVEKMAVDAEEYQKEWYDQVLDEIRTIRDDVAFAEDPDQWEDMEFTDKIGEICFYVMNV